MDLYNSEILSFSLSHSPTIDFTNESLEGALSNLPKEHQLIMHNDQCFRYQHASWSDLLESKGAKQSMSRRENCLDHSPWKTFSDDSNKRSIME